MPPVNRQAPGLPAGPRGGQALVPELPLESVVDPIKALFGDSGSATPPHSDHRPVPASPLGGGVLREVAAIAVPPRPPVAPPEREVSAGGIPVDWHRAPAPARPADVPAAPPADVPAAPFRPLVSPPVAAPVLPPPSREGVADEVPDLQPSQVAERSLNSGELAAKQQQPPVAATALSAADLSELLTGAGLQGRAITPQMARQLGQILRVVIAGVLDVLHARQQTKEAFRIPGTVIRSKGNNPLKHSVDVNDALYNLFVKGGAGYLGPVEAFEDAFADVKNHQLAMLEGIRAAFQAMLERFDPDGLQEKFERIHSGRRKSALDKLKGSPDYWSMYRAWVHELTDDADGSFRRLFGEVFSDAYEVQLQQLKASRKGGRDNEP
jgi:type VI secretion system FHA domain protein